MSTDDRPTLLAIQHVPWEGPHRILDACGGLARADGEAARRAGAAGARRGRRRGGDGRADERRRGRALPGAGDRARVAGRGGATRAAAAGHLPRRAAPGAGAGGGGEAGGGAGDRLRPGRGQRPRRSGPRRPRAQHRRPALAWRRLRAARRGAAAGLLGADRAPGLPPRQRLGRALPSRGRLRPGRGLAGGAGDDRRGASRRSATRAPTRCRNGRRRRSRHWSSARRRGSRRSPRWLPAARAALRRPGGRTVRCRSRRRS